MSSYKSKSFVPRQGFKSLTVHRKFTAAFYQEAPEVDVGTSLPPDVSGLEAQMPTSSELQPGSPHEAPRVKDHKRGPIITPTDANTFRSSTDAIHSKALPVTVPSNEPTYQPPDSRISVSPPTIPDVSEQPSSSLLPPECNPIDVSPPANDIEVWNVETRIQMRKENTRMNSPCSSQEDEVLFS